MPSQPIGAYQLFQVSARYLVWGALVSEERLALMERESVGLEREFEIAEKSYGTDHLDLVLTNDYLGNARRGTLPRSASPRYSD